MRPHATKIVVGIIALVAIIVVIVFLVRKEPELVPTEQTTATSTERVIGTSVEGRSITATTFGSGDTNILFVGGIHGGYEWNSVLLAYEAMDYLKENPDVLPKNLSVTIVPNANPDGVVKVVKKEGRFFAADVPEGDDSIGRFNANSVDLNRNFDCKWKPESMWRGKVVSAGTAAFSEPEARAIRDLVLAEKPAAVVFWHSQANAVYASECENGILAGTRTLMNTYASAAGYPAVDVFDSYEVTGDAEGWLASINIPAVTVELSSHDTIEWNKNLAGMKAVLTQYAQ